MAETFNVSLRKVCPACSERCLTFKPVIKEEPVYVTLIGASKIQHIACENENICRECWSQSVNALNRIGDYIDIRTVWRTKREEVDE